MKKTKKRAASAKYDDIDIAKAILKQLAMNDTIPKEHIRVKVRDGGVTLSGEVMWKHQNDAIVKIVNQFADVHLVKNKIVINPHLIIHPEILHAFPENEEIDKSDWGVPM
jgi:osmotically-inducible protein OsmY